MTLKAMASLGRVWEDSLHHTWRLLLTKKGASIAGPPLEMQASVFVELDIVVAYDFLPHFGVAGDLLLQIIGCAG